MTAVNQIVYNMHWNERLSGQLVTCRIFGCIRDGARAYRKKEKGEGRKEKVWRIT